MMEQRAEVERLTLEDCRRLLGEGRASEALRALEALEPSLSGDASLQHFLGVALHLVGRSKEALPHFEQAHALEPDQASVYQNQAIALLSAGDADGAVAAAARAVELRPDNAGGYVNLVLPLIKRKSYDEAATMLQEGLRIAPGHAGLLTQAGHLAIETKDWAAAEDYTRAALQADPGSIDAIYNMAVLRQHQGRHAEALADFSKVLTAHPTHEAAFVNMGVSLRNLGRVDDAVRHFSAGLARWPDLPALRYNLAVSRLYLGQWREGWPDYELRAELAGSLDKTTRSTMPLWDGGAITGKTLLVLHEQGFGDTFQFIRFIYGLTDRAAKVIFVCHKRLYSLLSRLDIFASGRIELIADEGSLPPHDVHIPLMSLTRIFQIGPDNIPIGFPKLALESSRIERWRSLGRQLDEPSRPWRIGLSWQGNPAAAVDRGRSIPLADFEPLSALGDRVGFLSLQRHFGTDQPLPFGLNLTIPGEEFDSGEEAFVDTAALMMSLDLVITSDTAVAHLAGMMGRPVWLLLKKTPDWRWGPEGVLSPWYPTMRLFRQKTEGDWRTLLEEVAGELERLVVSPKERTDDSDNAVRQALQLHMRGKVAEAAPIYQAEHGARRSDPQFLNFHAMAILEAGARNAAAARSGLALGMQSVALAPGVGDYWSNVAVLLDSMGNRADSKRALRFALAVNPGHVPSLVSLAKKESADGDPEKALRTLKTILDRAPNTVPALSALANVYADMGRHLDGARALRRAVDVEPENSKLWVQLGAEYSAAERPFDAAVSWERALAANPVNADAWSNLGVHERTHGPLELSCYLQRRAVECDPQHAEAWNNLGIAELEATRDQVSIEAFSQAIAVRPGYPDAHLALGMALLNSGDFENGLKHYEWRLMADKLGIATNRPNIPLWRGDDPKGLSIFLMAEQGFGDAFQFSRYAIWLKERGAAKVYIGCRSKIAHLLGTIPGVDAVFGDGAKLPKADAMAYIMSMPALTGMRLDTIPAHESYMTADPVRVTRWAEWLAAKPGFRVGIVWQGNPDPKVDKGRSYPLAALEPLSRIPGVRLIALQKGPGEEQIEALGGRFEVERPDDDFDTGTDAFADTAAMMMNLDLVVTSDTAVAHLAGALGKPCWVVLKAHPEWRWLTERSDSPWYPSSRLFRRFKDEEEDTPFAAVMERLAAALAKLAGGDLSQRHVSAPDQPKQLRSFDAVKTYNSALDAQRAGQHARAEALYAEVLSVKSLRLNALHMLGVIALHKDRNHRAVVMFREAERQGLATAQFYTNLSIGLRRIGKIDEAIGYLTRAIEIKPTAEAHLSLGNIYRDECRFDEARENYRAAIAINPKMSKAHRGMGNLMRDMHRPMAALESFAVARSLDPDDADLLLDQAHAELYAGDYIKGFENYEVRWKSREMKPRTFNVPRWDGRARTRKTVLIHGEQGFGDNIQFGRFIEEAARRVGQVIVEVREPLLTLFRTLDVGKPITVVEQGKFDGSFDLEVPMMSLPHVFKTTVDSLPPPARFAIDPDRIDFWETEFPHDRLRVGLIWQGNPKARADQGRSPPLSALQPLFEVPGVQFISLQKTDGLAQLADTPFARDMIVPGAALGDFHETAAAIMALDLVISSCTATLHLAASLGVPCFAMLKYHADWRWLHERQTSPWYPSMQIFQQKTVFDWSSVVLPLRDALGARVGMP
ncbi:tetratricopeptide repeat protein [Rhizobium sp. KVB221]|uniref:Tetratricopeptide repeat protein n=1 Tax=Rhizobium setariae TaxID=2801340 RepID=A0A937CPF2_9HYPH|nr:tetratricopeptide repeat protein [Rhizobium setariae]MBL0374841.1 tetratricopeptide repeat protein [Rhizobium setariae]